ncbi:MAG: hypothetical protein RSE45_03980 [Bacilli bacterium]
MKEKKNVILTVLLIIIGVLFVSGIGLFAYSKYFKKDNENSNNDGKIKLTYISSYKKIDNMYDKYFVVSNNSSIGIIDIDGKIIEDIKYKDIIYLSDGYYITLLDNVKTLKRNGKLVADLHNVKETKAYKDTSDTKSPYIVVQMREDFNTKFDKSTLSIEKADENLMLLKVLTGENKENISTYETVVYDKTTGKIIKTLEGKVEPIKEMSSIVKYKNILQSSSYFSNYTYLDKDFNEIKNKSNERLIFNIAQCDGSLKDADINTKTKKYGYYNVEKGVEVLPAIYDKITSTNTTKTLFSYIENGKYGVVNDKNEIVIKPTNELIEIVNNYIIKVNNYNVEVLDNNFNPIYKYEIDKNKELVSLVPSMCGNRHNYTNYMKINPLGNNILNISTKLGLKTLIFWDNSKIDELTNNNYIDNIHDSEKDIYMVAIPTIKDNSIIDYKIYNSNKELLFTFNNLNIKIKELDYGDITLNMEDNYITASYISNNKDITKYYNVKTNTVLDKKEESVVETYSINKNLSYKIEPNKTNANQSKITLYNNNKIVGSLNENSYYVTSSCDKYIITKDKTSTNNFLHKIEKK